MENRPVKIKKGFTLIELIVAIAIIAIVFPSISSVFINAMKNTKQEDIKLTTMTEVQAVIQKLKSQSGFGIGIMYQNLYKGNSDKILTINIGFNDVNTLIDKSNTSADLNAGLTGLFDFVEPTDKGSIDYTKQSGSGSDYINFSSYYNASTNDYGINYNNNYNYLCKIEIQPTSNVYFETYKITVTITDLKNPDASSIGYAYTGGN